MANKGKTRMKNMIPQAEDKLERAVRESAGGKSTVAQKVGNAAFDASELVAKKTKEIKNKISPLFERQKKAPKSTTNYDDVFKEGADSNPFSKVESPVNATAKTLTEKEIKDLATKKVVVDQAKQQAKIETQKSVEEIGFNSIAYKEAQELARKEMLAKQVIEAERKAAQKLARDSSAKEAKIRAERFAQRKRNKMELGGVMKMYRNDYGVF
jgi:hypothetical protein